MKKASVILMCFLALFSFKFAFAQYPVWDDPNSLPQWMTPEEELRKKEIGATFQRTGEPTTPVNSIAEFERQKGALVRYYNGLGIPYSVVAEISEQSKVYTIVATTSQKNVAITNYTNNGVNMNNCEWIIAPTNSMWTRDYGPMFITTGNNSIGVVDFPYNRPRASDDAIPGVVANYLNLTSYGMDVIHTGGNYMSDGLGIGASTNLVYEENNNDAAFVNQEMLDFLGIQNYHVTLDPLGDYIKHIDCWGKFLDVDKILIAEVPASNPNYLLYEQIADYFENQISAYGTPFQVYRVYEPSGQPYTNSFILNNKVYVPTKNSSYDAPALAVYQSAMPGYEVLGYYSSSWATTDALHCRVHEIADAGMLRITHVPLHGDHPYQPTYQVNAEIIAYSGQTLKTDSLFVIYKANLGSYDTIPLVYTQGNIYTGYIPALQTDTLITYYLFAADYSGRRENWPLIGAPGARSFKIIMTNVPVTGVTLNPTSANLIVGQTLQLEETIEPENASNTNVIWSSSNTSIATVNESGLIIANNPGSVTISVTTEESGYTASTNIEVANNLGSVTATYNSGDIPTDNEFTALPGSSSCPGNLSVNIPANVYITAVDVSYSMTASHYGYMADQRSQLICISPGGISESLLAIGYGNATGTYFYERTGLDIANNVTGGGIIQFELHTGRTWSSIDYSGCQTYNNKVDDGTWTITVHYSLVEVPVTGITLNPADLNLLINTTSQLTATIFPANATNQQIIWSSSNNSVASVDCYGMVTGTGSGEAIITSTTSDGGFSANCFVITTVPVTGITVTPEAATLDVNDIYQLTGSILPSNASNQNYLWSSANSTIATVSSNGLVTAHTSGTVKIIATTTDGGFSDSCQVTVNSTCSAEGIITFEKWDNISGNTIPDLTGNINYPNNPTYTSNMTQFEIPYNVGDNYGVKVSGYICAPLTGSYRFWIAGDDNVELWLSSDNNEANKIKIAYHTGYTRSRQWNKYSTQKSVYFNLVQGNSYYIEALMKHGTGTDNLAVGWLKPGQTGTSPSEVIPGNVLSPKGPIETLLPVSEILPTNELTFRIYPNPSSGFVSIKMNENHPEIEKMMIMTSSGQVIFQHNSNFEKDLLIDLNNCSSGVYFIKIQTSEWIENKKLIIAK